MDDVRVRCPVCGERVELRTHRAVHGLRARLRELREVPAQLLRAVRAVVHREN